MSKKLLNGIVVVIIYLFFVITSCAKTEVYFTHIDNIQTILVLKIDNAEESIDVSIYTFTDLILVDALIRAKDRGIDVRIHLDRSQVYARYTQSKYAVRNALDVRISSNKYIMHNKFAIIDDDFVITGSYNWTKAANTRNDENILIIDCPYVIKIYQEQFERLWEQYSTTLFEILFERATEEVQ